MKNRRDLLIISGLFLALILFIAFGPSRQPAVPQNVPTTHSSGDNGASAFYSWIQEMEYDAQRLEYRDFGLSDADDALIILNPSEPISRANAELTLDWVEQGGTLIMADDTLAIFGASNALLDELKVDVVVYSTTTTIERAAPLQPALDQPPTGEAPVRSTRMLLPQRDDYIALLGTHDALLVAGIQHGSGYVYLSATSFPFTNAGLTEEQNARLVLNMLRRVPPGGRVQFDEYHHGYYRPPTPATAIFTNPWGWGMAYAAITVALYLILSGRRFGRPVPLKEEVARRSSAEYVESMADLFQRGGKRAYILRHYHTAFKRRLARPYGISPQLEDQEFVRELERAHEFDEQALLDLLARLRNNQASEEAMLRAVSDADAYLATMRR